MTANVITYRDRSAAREVGKVLGIEPAQVDRLAKVMHGFEFRDPAETLDGHFRDAGLAGGERVRLFADLWRQIQNLPRHLGQHSGGMVICQGRLDTVVPLENASMPGRAVIQWDKDDCAEPGDHEGGSARPGHDGRVAGCAGAGESGECRRDWGFGIRGWV